MADDRDDMVAELQREVQRLAASNHRVIEELEMFRRGGDPCQFAEERCWNSANYPVICLDLDMKYDFVNPAVCELLEISPEVMIGKDALQLTPEAMRFVMRETYEKALAGIPTRNFRLPRKTTTGKTKWLVVSFCPRYDSNGNICGIVSCGQDITDLYLAEQEQSRLSREAHALLEHANSPVLSVHADFRVELWNKNAEKVFGFKRDEVVGLRLSDIGMVSENDAEAWEQVIQRTIEGNPESNFETVLYSKAGEARCVLQNSTLRHDIDGKVMGVLIFLFDITQIKYIAEQEQLLHAAQASNELKSKFLASMSHETRTPLNIILGNTQLLADGPSLSPEHSAFVHEISSSAQSLCGLIDDILDLARMEAGTLTLASVDFNFRDLIEAAAAAAAPQAHAKGVTVCSFLDPRLPAPWVRGDRNRVWQALMHLLSNAVKFTASGHVSLTATAQQRAGSHVTWHVSVEDSGIGVSREAQAKLFRRFSQVDDATTRSFGGAGIGLALTKELAELMDGGVGVWSKEGAGSKFWFTVVLDDPATKEEEDEEGDAARSIQVEEGSVLVVCADPALRDSLQTTCTRIGMQVATTTTATTTTTTDTNADDVVSGAAGGTFDAVVLAVDVHRMWCDGEATTQQRVQDDIAAIRRAHRAATVIVLSADSIRGRLASSMHADDGGVVVLAQPVPLQDLASALRSACARPAEVRSPPTAVLAVCDRAARTVLKAMLCKDGWRCEMVDGDEEEEVLSAVKQHAPSLVVVSSSSSCAVQLCGHVRAVCERCRILVVGCKADGSEAQALLAAGASGVLVKPFSRDYIRSCIHLATQAPRRTSSASLSSFASPASPLRLRRRASRADVSCKHNKGRGMHVRVLVVHSDDDQRGALAKMLEFLGASVDTAATSQEWVDRTGSLSYHVMVVDSEVAGQAGWEVIEAIRRREEESWRARRVVIIGMSSAENAARCHAYGMNDVLVGPVSLSQVVAVIQSRVVPPSVERGDDTDTESLDAHSMPSSTTSSLAAESSSNRLESGCCSVLLVEDHPVCQRMLRTQLERMGHRVECTENGERAVESAMSTHFDVILMDCNMPVMDGWTAASLIRRHAGPNQATPIIAVTANAMKGDRDKCLDAGMTDYTPKPVMKKRLQVWPPHTQAANEMNGNPHQTTAGNHAYTAGNHASTQLQPCSDAAQGVVVGLN